MAATGTALLLEAAETDAKRSPAAFARSHTDTYIGRALCKTRESELQRHCGVLDPMQGYAEF